MKLAICTPVFGNVHPAYVTSLLQTILDLSHRGVAVDYCQSKGPDVARQRNLLVARALADPAVDALLFVDADQSWPAGLAHEFLNRTDCDILAAPVRKKTPQPLWNVRPMGAEALPRDGVLEVAAVGTGFMMVRRDVLVEMIEKHRTRKLAPPPGMLEAHAPYYSALFLSHIDADRRLISEDLAFCELAREQGFRVWVDPYAKVSHHGDATYAGDFVAEAFMPAAVEG